MSFPKLFLADQCPHSQRLWVKYSKQLSECPAIYVFSRKDRNAKRVKETSLAIGHHRVKQFPTILFADGTRLQSSQQIEQDLMESLQTINDKPLIPRYQDHPQQEQPPRAGYGDDPNATFNLHDRTIQQSMIGSWPSGDDVQINQQQQRFPNYHQQQEPHFDAQQQYMTSPSAHQVPPQQQPTDGRLKAFNAIGSNLPPTGAGCEGIGTSADVDTSAAGAGSSTSMMPTNVPSNDEDYESIGDWPTSSKVNGLTGRGNRNIESFHAGRASQHQNVQNMNMHLGQVVSDPVPGF